MSSRESNTREVTWFDVLTRPARLEIIRALIDLRDATATELVAHSHASDPTVRRHLDALVELGIVWEQVGEGDGLTPGRPAARFSLTPDARETSNALLQLLGRRIGSAP